MKPKMQPSSSHGGSGRRRVLPGSTSATSLAPLRSESRALVDWLSDRRGPAWQAEMHMHSAWSSRRQRSGRRRAAKSVLWGCAPVLP